MEFTENQIYFFEKAFSNTLKEDEKLTFEKMLKDASIADAYLDYSSIQNTIKEKGRENLKSLLQQIESKNTVTKKNKISIIKALAVVLSIFISCFLIYNSFFKSAISGEKIYYAYYSNFPNTIDPLTKGKTKNVSAYQLYEQQKYTEAINIFKTYTSSDTTDFFIALSHLGNENLEQSIPLFQKLVNKSEINNTSSFALDSKWYLALSYMKNKDLNLAIPIFRELQNSNHSFYALKAKSILKELHK